jgi:hypothetical protein
MLGWRGVEGLGLLLPFPDEPPGYLFPGGLSHLGQVVELAELDPGREGVPLGLGEPEHG